MPSIKDRTGLNLKGFEPIENPVIPPSGTLPGFIPGVAKGNAMIRTPLPPMNADPDSLRQFDESGAIPTKRVIPLPANVSPSGGSTTVVTNVISSSTSGGGGAVVPSSLSIASLTLSIPSIGVAGKYVTKVTMSKSFQLFQLISTQALEVRMYGSAASQGADLARATDVAPAFETTSGIISDVVFDTSPFQWSWQNRVGTNADATQTSDIYITVVNPSASGTPAATLTVIYLPLLS